jgi:transposase
LAKLYYDLSNTGAYIGPSKLYEIIKSRGINDIGLHTIRKWLQSQDNYSLQKPISKSYKKCKGCSKQNQGQQIQGQQNQGQQMISTGFTFSGLN